MDHDARIFSYVLSEHTAMASSVSGLCPASPNAGSCGRSARSLATCPRQNALSTCRPLGMRFHRTLIWLSASRPAGYLTHSCTSEETPSPRATPLPDALEVGNEGHSGRCSRKLFQRLLARQQTRRLTVTRSYWDQRQQKSFSEL